MSTSEHKLGEEPKEGGAFQGTRNLSAAPVNKTDRVRPGPPAVNQVTMASYEQQWYYSGSIRIR